MSLLSSSWWGFKIFLGHIYYPSMDWTFKAYFIQGLLITYSNSLWLFFLGFCLILRNVHWNAHNIFHLLSLSIIFFYIQMLCGLVHTCSQDFNMSLLHLYETLSLHDFFDTVLNAFALNSTSPHISLSSPTLCSLLYCHFFVHLVLTFLKLICVSLINTAWLFCLCLLQTWIFIL